MHPRRRPLLAVLLAALLPLAGGPPAAGEPAPPPDSGVDPASSAYRAPELSTSDRLRDRRSLVVGDRFYAMGAEDGSYPATGFHTRGEMGGFWTPPIKLLDGIWFGVGARQPAWLTATSYTHGWGYQRMDLGTVTVGGQQVGITRTDIAPDGVRAGLIGLRLSSRAATTVPLTMDAHSELMKSYPWGETTPSQTTYNLQDTGKVVGGALEFREQGSPPVQNTDAHDYAAYVGSSLQPTTSTLGPDFRGPQDPAVTCGPSGPDTPPTPERCDDTAYGKGTGGRLTYTVDVPAGGRTVWFAVAGSDEGVAPARQAFDRVLAAPAATLRATVAARRADGARTRVSLPGDRLLEQSVEWSKQNLAESVQEARDLQVRVTNAGTKYPPVQGSVPRARWFGAGWPDYPWIFGTDGEYTAHAALAAGQFEPIKDHLRALRDVSLVANGDSGKVVHEVTPDGQVYFGANDDPGNTDETSKFPSAVALIWRWTGDDGFRDEMYDFTVRNMRYVFRELDEDGDGWPEGLGNVERDGMGEEKLDNTVYTIRGLRDLADLAASKGDRATRVWATDKAEGMERRFDATWWTPGDARQYADSLENPDNTRVFQRHWTGVTPVEAQIKKPGRSADRPLAPLGHARTLVAQRERSCYTGELGLFHTGSAGCDSTTSTVPAERAVFTLNSSIMAVAEAALGRMGPSQLKRYTTGNARVQLDPSIWELPGAMPEIAPSPDFEANIERKFTERSMALQAWGAYGVLWPVVHYQLGVAPDLGRATLRVVPQVPSGQTRVSGSAIRLGRGQVAVSAVRQGRRLDTVVRQDRRWRLTIGALLPSGATVKKVRLDRHRASYQVVTTARGREVWVNGGRGTGTTRLRVFYR